jgi:hypothetical protein
MVSSDDTMLVALMVDSVERDVDLGEVMSAISQRSSRRTPGPILRGLSRFWAVAVDTFSNNQRRWLWVPAFAGTTGKTNVHNPLIIGSEVSISLSHVAVRNPCIDEFFAVSLVSQTRIKLQCMRLGVQEEIANVSQIRSCLNRGDQQLANTNTSIRPAHGHATDLGRRTVIPQHSRRRTYRLAVSQRHKMPRFAIMLIALHIDGNALFDDKDLVSNPKTLFDVLRRTRSSDCYHPGLKSCARRASESSLNAVVPANAGTHTPRHLDCGK